MYDLSYGLRRLLGNNVFIYLFIYLELLSLWKYPLRGIVFASANRRLKHIVELFKVGLTEVNKETQ